MQGGEYDDWDLAVVAGPLGRARMLMAIEDHGAGTQYIRTRVRPWVAPAAVVLSSGLAVLAIAAVYNGALEVGALLCGATLSVVGRTVYECASAVGAVRCAITVLERSVV